MTNKSDEPFFDVILAGPHGGYARIFGSSRPDAGKVQNDVQVRRRRSQGDAYSLPNHAINGSRA